MGSCGCSRLRDDSYREKDMVGLSLNTFCASRITKNMHTPQAFDPDFSFDIGTSLKNELQLESPHNPDSSEAQLGVKHLASFSLQHPTNDRLLYPTMNGAGTKNGNNDMPIDPYCSQSKKQIMNKPGYITDREITRSLPRLSQNEDIKAVDIWVNPATKHISRNQRSARRTRSLSSLDWSVTPECEHCPANRLVDREQESTHSKLNVIVNDDCLLETYPTKLSSDCEKLSWTNFEPTSAIQKSSNNTSTSGTSTAEEQADDKTWEIFEYSWLQYEETLNKSKEFNEKLKNMRSLAETLSTISFSKLNPSETLNIPIHPVKESSIEGQGEISSQRCENYPSDLNGEELRMISRDIDKLELKINQTRTRIRELRLESVNIIRADISEKASHPSSGSNALNYLEIEQKIRQLEDKSHELENKRQAAVSRLQYKIVGNLLGKEQKELLPLLPIPMPWGLRASIPLNSLASLSLFDVPDSETSREKITKFEKIPIIGN